MAVNMEVKDEILISKAINFWVNDNKVPCCQIDHCRTILIYIEVQEGSDYRSSF